MIILEDNMSLLDVAVMLNGNINNILDFMTIYNYTIISENLEGKILNNPQYLTSNKLVADLLLNEKKVGTTELNEIAFERYSFSDGFSDGYDIKN